MSKNKETIADIVAEMRDEGHIGDASFLEWVGAKILHYADRIEAAAKREVESIHRAMVLIAGIEMENSENPPRLWTALEDAYDALSDALGTDGDTTADVEEAKAIGRHIVVKSYGNAAAKRENARLRAALKPVLECKVLSAMTAEIRPGESDYCSNIIFNSQRIYNEGEEKQKEGAKE